LAPWIRIRNEIKSWIRTGFNTVRNSDKKTAEYLVPAWPVSQPEPESCLRRELEGFHGLQPALPLARRHLRVGFSAEGNHSKSNLSFLQNRTLVLRLHYKQAYSFSKTVLVTVPKMNDE
jgi:hypothetical protein